MTDTPCEELGDIDTTLAHGRRPNDGRAVYNHLKDYPDMVAMLANIVGSSRLSRERNDPLWSVDFGTRGQKPPEIIPFDGGVPLHLVHHRTRNTLYGTRPDEDRPNRTMAPENMPVEVQRSSPTRVTRDAKRIDPDSV